MLPCPIPECGYPNTLEATICEKCGEDLTSFAKLYFLPAYHFNRGLAAARNGELNEAIEELQIAVTLDRGNVDSLILLGKICAQKGDYSGAIEYWQHVLDINPDNIKANKGIEKAAKLLDEALSTSTVALLSDRIFYTTLVGVYRKVKSIEGEQKKQFNDKQFWLKKILSLLAMVVCVIVVFSILLWGSLRNQVLQVSSQIAALEEQVNKLSTKTSEDASRLKDQIQSVLITAEEGAKQLDK